MAGMLYGVGVGPGDPELLTLKALRIMREVDVIACPEKSGKAGVAYEIAQGAYPEIVDKELLLLDFPMKVDDLEAAHKLAAKQLVKQLQAGKNVVFLTLGDPGVYSTFFYVAERVRQVGYEVEIINGIPSFGAVAAKLGLPLSLGDESITITSGEYKEVDGTLVIMKAGMQLENIKQKLMNSDKEVYLVENCGMPEEHIYRGFEEIPLKVSYFSILVVK